MSGCSWRAPGRTTRRMHCEERSKARRPRLAACTGRVVAASWRRSSSPVVAMTAAAAVAAAGRPRRSTWRPSSRSRPRSRSGPGRPAPRRPSRCSRRPTRTSRSSCRTSARARRTTARCARVLKSGKGLPGRRPHGVPVHPELHAHQEPARHDAVPAGQLPLELPGVDPEADPGRQAGSTACRGTPARSASSTARTWSRRPASRRRSRPGTSSRPRRRSTTSQSRSRTSSTCRAARRASGSALFWQNGARPFTTDPENFKADLTDPEDQAGHRVLGQALRERLDLA